MPGEKRADRFDSGHRTVLEMALGEGGFHRLADVPPCRLAHLAMNAPVGDDFDVLVGEQHVHPTVGLAVAAGWDTDSCGATAGSIAGAFIGRSSLPARWVDPLGDRLETAVFGFQGVTISEVADRTTRLATSPAHLVA